ncbi:MAG: alpha/beta hydrolase [Acidobacteria bacterium]|nr:alpha/beta hydrolase [Acidobacteriota bacterium]
MKIVTAPSRTAGNRLVVAALGLVTGLCQACMSFGPPSVEEAFAGRPAPEARTYELPDGKTLSAHETGNPDGPLVLFIHGTPGSWNDFGHVMADPAVASKAWLVSVDRPGWGESSETGLEPSLEEQAAALEPVLAAHSNQLPAIVVGHSYGGPVAALLAMKEPERVGGLAIVAGSIDPALEKPKWYQKVGAWPVVKHLIPNALAGADQEILRLHDQLEAMSGGWPKLAMPVIVVQGEKDSLVDPATADFAERVITEAPLEVRRIPDVGHLIPWEHPELITAAVADLLADEVSASAPAR